MNRRRRNQMTLPLRMRGRGGPRPGAGRKPAGDRAGVPHRARPRHRGYEPVHATMRAVPGLDAFRDPPVFLALENAIAGASRDDFRIVHFSIQRDHLHAIVEARDRDALMSGLRGLAIRTAKAVNRALDRKGRVWGDRYHERALTTPREVRACLIYVLLNWKKSTSGAWRTDPMSSARWFDGFSVPVVRADPGEEGVVGGAGHEAQDLHVAVDERRRDAGVGHTRLECPFIAGHA